MSTNNDRLLQIKDEYTNFKVNNTPLSKESIEFLFDELDRIVELENELSLKDAEIGDLEFKLETLTEEYKDG